MVLPGGSVKDVSEVLAWGSEENGKRLLMLPAIYVIMGEVKVNRQGARLQWFCTAFGRMLKRVPSHIRWGAHWT